MEELLVPFVIIALLCGPSKRAERTTGWDDFKEGLFSPLGIAAVLLCFGVAFMLVMLA